MAAAETLTAGAGAEKKKEKKKIVICCDGTGNKFIAAADPNNSNSNVVKLYTTLRIHNEQVGYYHPGVGTAGDPAARTWPGQQWSKIKGLAFGAGFRNNLFDAYRYLMDTYDDGDELYLFGFSRGSYGIRAMAALLDGYGLLCKGNQDHLSYAWNEYAKQMKTRGRRRVQPNRRFKETFSHKGFRIDFVGIWDTVSSVGWITSPLRLYSVAQNPTVKVARHAISIDERRCFYRDNRWLPATEDQLKEVATPEDLTPQQDVLQVWFAGVHSDVGGSYPQAESGLTNVALRWLLREAEKFGADIDDIMVDLVLGNPVPATGDLLKDRKLDQLKPLYWRPIRAMVHKSLWGPWWLLELLPHRYYDLDDGEEQWRTPLGMSRRIVRGTLVHGSVWDRLHDVEASYRPRNLRGGAAALHKTNKHCKDGQSIYEYKPETDEQPWQNNGAVRWAVMLAVSAADVAVLGGVVVGIRWLWHLMTGILIPAV